MKEHKDRDIITSNYLKTLRDRNKRKKTFISVCSVLALFVAVSTVAEMIRPAAAVSRMETVLDCAFDVHQHTEECYEIIYDEEGNETGKELICGQADFVAHQHTDACYKTVFNEETQEEEKVLICELPEIEPHVHVDSCYEERQVLICEEDHEHDETCYETEKVLTCEKPEIHTHGETCYDEDGNLICDKLEVLVHEHDENCLTTVEVVDAEPEAEEESETEPAVLEFCEETDELIISVTAPADAFPESTSMTVVKVEDEDVLSVAADAADQPDTKVTKVQAVDITFTDAEGNEVQPSLPIQVIMTPVDRLPEEKETAVVYHIDDQGEAANVALNQEVETEPEAVAFDVESFSVYALVYTVELETEVITAEGETFKITVTYNDDANIPENAELRASEITAEDSRFEEYKEEAKSLLESRAQIEDIRIFDISIFADEQEIEPAAPVAVNISYVDGMKLEEDDSIKVVHFAKDGTEILENEYTDENNTVTSVSFTTDSFSSYATIQQRLSQNMNDGMIAYFSFDDLTNGFSGAGARAQKGLSDGLMLRAGQSGQSLYLDGRQYLTVTKENGTPLLTGLDEFTISYWCSTKEATSDGTHGNWAYYASGNNDPAVFQSEKYIGVVQEGNGFRAERYNSNGTQRPEPVAGPNATPMDEWHHVVVIYHADSTEVYIDGQPISEPVASIVDLSDMLGNNSTFYLGRSNWYNNGVYEGYRGYFDEFSVFNYALSKEEVLLMYENAYYHEADKISAKDLLNNQSYIIYNKVWNNNAGLTGAYEYYAIDGNGNLVKVYNTTDVIEYRSEASLEWKLIVYENEGTETGYFEFYNEETGKYLAPQSGQLLSDSVIGLHLNGRQDQNYTSTIEAWDNGAMSYYGYKYSENTTSPVLQTASENAVEDERDWEFYFAKPSYTQSVNELETVQTITNPAGLTIKMFDYPSGLNYASGHSSYSNYQNEIMSGIPNSTSGNQWNANSVTQGLVGNKLVDGFPVSTTTNRSLAPLFDLDDTRNNGKTVDNLFIQSTYDETGYYEFSSFENYAYLGNSNNFTVYRQLGGANAPNEEYYYSRGNFFPYNSISADGFVERDDQKNYYIEYTKRLIDENDPRYGETIYRAQGNIDYHFGMNLSADFIITNGGDDERGNPITFEFNGDDDMWVFVDGVLLLDMGGTHNAHSGSINFDNGKIVVQNTSGQFTTTIQNSFRSAGVFPDGTPYVESRASEYFDSDGTFVDYTAHHLEMYYMERGGGCSTIHVKFNLPIAQPGALRITKEVTDTDPRYVNETFWYQIFDQNNEPITSYGGATDAMMTLKNETTDTVITLGADGRFPLKAGETAVATFQDTGFHYYVKEILPHPDVYKEVSFNNDTVPINNGEAVSSTDTINHRPLVIVKNTPDKPGNLRITKFVESAIKEDPSPRFEFYVYLEDQNGDIVPYSQGIYYVMKDNEYYEYVEGELVKVPAGSDPTPLRSGQFGAIGQIPDGFSIFIPNLIPGTHFLVEERMDNIPEGYVYVKKELTANTYDVSSTDSTYEGTAPDGKIKLDTTADVVVTNRPNGKIIGQKEWEDGGFVTVHGDIYAALYKRTGTGSSATYTLVENTVKKLQAPEYKVEYYLPNVPEGIVISDYVIREVKVTVNPDDGSITVNSMVDDGGIITVTGETTTGINGQGTETNASDSYTVSYEEGTETTGADGITVRTDTITNTLPKVSMFKINESSGQDKKYLEGAVFALQDTDGNPIKDATGQDITFTSGTDGKLFEDRYFSNGTYYFKETTAPPGYVILKERIVLTVSEDGISATLGSGQSATPYVDQDTDDALVFKFEIMNNPGAELPYTGGSGTTVFVVSGLALIMFSLFGIVMNRKRNLIR